VLSAYDCDCASAGDSHRAIKNVRSLRIAFFLSSVGFENADATNTILINF
jgi:hypothetical protein